MTEKVFKTYDEQIDLLVKRGLIVDDRDKAIQILKKENYYNLINGYNDLFLANTQPEECYKKGANFVEVFALYDFDRVLRELLLIELLRIEKCIRTTITHVFSSHYGHDHRTYLDPAHFNTRNEVNQKNTQEIIDDLQKLIQSHSSNHKAIAHYLDKHKYIPLWVLSAVITFGTLNKFFTQLQLAKKQEITAAFNLSIREFEPFLYILSSFRNKCAHGERIYYYAKDGAKPRFIPELNYHHRLHIPKNSKGYKYGTNDILAVLITMKHFMPKDRYATLIVKIEEILTKLSSKLFVVKIDEVNHIMGLVPNWTDLRKI